MMDDRVFQRRIYRKTDLSVPASTMFVHYLWSNRNPAGSNSLRSKHKAESFSINQEEEDMSSMTNPLSANQWVSLNENMTDGASTSNLFCGNASEGLVSKDLGFIESEKGSMDPWNTFENFLSVGSPKGGCSPMLMQDKCDMIAEGDGKFDSVLAEFPMVSVIDVAPGSIDAEGGTKVLVCLSWSHYDSHLPSESEKVQVLLNGQLIQGVWISNDCYRFYSLPITKEGEYEMDFVFKGKSIIAPNSQPIKLKAIDRLTSFRESCFSSLIADPKIIETRLEEEHFLNDSSKLTFL